MGKKGKGGMGNGREGRGDREGVGNTGSEHGNERKRGGGTSLKIGEEVGRAMEGRGSHGPKNWGGAGY